MRILMIAPEPFLEPRGTPFSVFHRIKALLALGYQVDLLTYPIGKQVSLPGLKIYRTPKIPFIHKVKIGPSLAKFPLDALLFLRAMQLMCQKHYQYIHTHEEAGAMGVLLSSIFDCQHLYDMHSDLAQQMSNFGFTKNPLLIRCVEAIQRWIVRNADMVIAICPDLKFSVERLAPKKPVCLIENVAVDEMLPPANEESATQLRQELQLGDGPILLYTGTLEFYQGIDLLLQSVVHVHAAFPTARYLLLGGQPEQIVTYQSLAQQLGITEIVHFIGQRPVEEMPRYMALADILLSPRSEGTNTPLKLYTYLRSGKPIVATAIHSHTQVLTSSTAMLVSPTPEGLAQGTLELLQNPEKAHVMGENGKIMANKYYSWTAFLEKNRCAYELFERLRLRNKSRHL